MRLLLLLLLGLAATRASAGALPLDGVERGFMARIVASRPFLGDVWPAFTPPEALLLHFPGKGSVLLGGATPAKGYRPLDEAERRRLSLPRGLAASFDPGGRTPIATVFQPELDIAGTRAFALVFDEDAPLDEQLVLLFHESFHRFQPRVFAAGTLRHSEARPPEDAETAAMHLVENELLLAALTDPAGWPRLARDFLAVRERRLSRSPAGTREWEDAFERHEGLAEYAGQRAAMPAGLDAHAASLLAGPRLAPLLLDTADPERTMGVYGAGAAQAFLLDRLKAPWKARAEKGASLTDLLAEALPDQDRASAARKALERRGWGDLVDQQRSAVRRGMNPEGATAPEAVSDGTRLVLRVWDPKVEGLSTTGSAPRSTPEGTVYAHVSAAELAGIKDFHATYRDTRLIERSGKEARPGPARVSVYATEFVSFLGNDSNVTVEIDGKAVGAPPNTARFGRLVLRSSKASVDVSRPGRIQSDAAGITIDLDPR